MSGLTDSNTFRLFKRFPNSPFIDGMGSVLDLWDTDLKEVYNYDADPESADGNSIRDDWRQVGNDLQESIRKYASSQPQRHAN